MNHLDESVLRLKREEMHVDIHRNRQQRTGKPPARVRLWTLLLMTLHLR